LADGINNASDIVGNSYSYTRSGFTPTEAVEWLPNGKAIVLPDVGGTGHSEAWAINNAGDIVGFSYTDSGRGVEAVEWLPNGTAIVLPDAGGQGSSFAHAINNAGDIVGWSYTTSSGSPSEEAVDLGDDAARLRPGGNAS